MRICPVFYSSINACHNYDDVMVSGPSVAGATALELACAWDLWSGENYVPSSFWYEGIIRIDAGESNHRG